MAKSARDSSLDAVKGFTILIVMLGHVLVLNKINDPVIYDWIKAVQMPLFMMVSGYLCGKAVKVGSSAGNAAQLMAKEGKYATLRLPSGEMRMVPIECRATIGVVGNGDHNLVKIGKAGRKRHMGIRPTVRGSVMNPNDHPHGGGEGKTGIGRPGPCTPWGKPALGLKTRKKNKQSNKLIVRRRNGKAIS